MNDNIIDDVKTDNDILKLFDKKKAYVVKELDFEWGKHSGYVAKMRMAGFNEIMDRQDGKATLEQAQEWKKLHNFKSHLVKSNKNKY